MKKKLVGLALGLMAFAGMMSFAQASDSVGLASTTNLKAEDTLGMKADRQMAPLIVAKKTDNVKGMAINDKCCGDSWSLVAKVGDPAWKSAKANEGGGLWKSASTGSGATEGVFASRPGYIPLTRYATVIIIDPDRVLGATASSFVSATTASSPSDRDLMATSFTSPGTLARANGEKSRGSHVPGTGISLAFASKDYDQRDRQVRST